MLVLQSCKNIGQSQGSNPSPFLQRARFLPLDQPAFGVSDMERNNYKLINFLKTKTTPKLHRLPRLNF